MWSARFGATAYAPHTGCDPRSKAVKTNENTRVSHLRKPRGSHPPSPSSFSRQICVAMPRRLNSPESSGKGVPEPQSVSVPRRNKQRVEASSDIGARLDRVKDGKRPFLPCDSSESGRALYVRTKAAFGSRGASF